MHNEAFVPAERQYTIERMTDAAESNESLMLLTEGTEVVGYLFLEVRRFHEVVYFWYLAIDKAKRVRGLGTSMVEHTFDVVRDRWPACRAVFLETAHPTDPDDSASDEMRRVTSIGVAALGGCGASSTRSRPPTPRMTFRGHCAKTRCSSP